MRKLDIAPDSALWPASQSRADKVGAAFDQIAKVFDSSLENDITRRLRRIIYSVVLRYVKTGSEVVDINCGTGIDAVRLLHLGYHVTGIDISQEMIRQARQKAAMHERRSLTFVVSSYDDLPTHIQRPVDAVFSNFGGLNCTQDLSATATSIDKILKSGGFFVGIIMPPFSVWEFLSYAARFQWKNAVRRLRSSTPATGFPKTTFPVFYYTPQNVVRKFGSGYKLATVIGLSVFSPPPQSTGFVRRFPRLSEVLFRFDKIASGLPLIRLLGDHFVIVLEKCR